MWKETKTIECDVNEWHTKIIIVERETMPYLTQCVCLSVCVCVFIPFNFSIAWQRKLKKKKGIVWATMQKKRIEKKNYCLFGSQRRWSVKRWYLIRKMTSAKFVKRTKNAQNARYFSRLFFFFCTWNFVIEIDNCVVRLMQFNRLNSECSLFRGSFE